MMSKGNELVPHHPSTHQSTFGDRVRDIASQLRHESDIQIQATSRILGAAAQLAQNHDQLIDEVVEMVETDLAQQAQAAPIESPTIEHLQQRFKTLKAAKAHFGVKATSWAMLAAKLGQATANQPPTVVQPMPTQTQDWGPRIAAIEQDIHAIRQDLSQMANLLNLLADKLL